MFMKGRNLSVVLCVLISSGLKPGRLFDCQFYHADAWVCMSQEQSRRKYDWVEYEDGRILGKKDQCESELIYAL